MNVIGIHLAVFATVIVVYFEKLPTYLISGRRE